jgi:RNA recognition motif
MTRRLYLGSMTLSLSPYAQSLTCCLGLPHDVRQEEVTKFFDGYGRIVDCRVMTGTLAFVSWD